MTCLDLLPYYLCNTHHKDEQQAYIPERKGNENCNLLNKILDILQKIWTPMGRAKIFDIVMEPQQFSPKSQGVVLCTSFKKKSTGRY